MHDVLVKQIAFSHATFGDGQRTGGVTAHILKELLEVREEPSAEEWTDVAILAFDGLTRQIRAERGVDAPEEIATIAAAGYSDKIDRNTRRSFPKPKDENTPSEAADGQGAVRWKPGQAAFDVLAERRRQVEGEGWTPAYDDGHAAGDLAFAAASYCVSATGDQWSAEMLWPWDEGARKATSPRRDLVKAAALIIAEIERLDRKAAREASALEGKQGE